MSIRRGAAPDKDLSTTFFVRVWEGWLSKSGPNKDQTMLTLASINLLLYWPLGHFRFPASPPSSPRIVNFGNTVEHVPSMEDAYDRTWAPFTALGQSQDCIFRCLKVALKGPVREPIYGAALQSPPSPHGHGLPAPPPPVVLWWWWWWWWCWWW